MTRERYARRILIALFLVVFACQVTAFGETSFHTEKSRDGDILIRLPEGWSLLDEDYLSTDADVSGSEWFSFCVFDMFDDQGDYVGSLHSVYEEEPTFAAVECKTPDGVINYYEEYGKNALQTVLDDTLDVTEIPRTYEVVPPAKDRVHYMIRTKAKDGSYLAYVIHTTDHLTGILLFDADDVPLPETEAADRIARSLSWGTYDENLYYDEYDSGVLSGDDLFDTGLLFLFIPLVIVGLVSALANQKKEKPAESRLPNTPEKIPPEPVAEVRKKPKKEKPLLDKLPKSAKKPLAPDGLPQIRHGEPVHYSGYYESLKTLRRSGLITREEMNELLQKHKDDLQ